MLSVTVRTMQYRRYKPRSKYKEWEKHNYNSQKHKEDNDTNYGYENKKINVIYVITIFFQQIVHSDIIVTKYIITNMIK